MDSDNDICDDSEKYQLYLQRLLWRPTCSHTLFSGSFFELPMCYVAANLTDLDRMIINPNIIAIPSDVAIVRNLGEEILIIDTRDTQTGFVRLLKEHSNNGPAVTFPLSGLNKIELLNGNKITQDDVDAIFCSYWPSEAQDWITRTTLSGWPEEGIKDHIVRGGCHFVAKSHHTEPDDSTQWRYSFSQAEIVLINSWNDVQKYIYHILRIIKRRITKTCGTHEKSVFNNYLIKTLMLWACEKKPAEFWAEANVEASVEELLCEAIACLIDRECPHYFITGLNILDCSVGTDITSEVSMLEQLMCNGLSRIMADFPKYNEKMNLHVEISTKLIKHLSFIHHKCINPLDPTFAPYNFSGEFSGVAFFYSELQNLFRGIMTHYQLQSLNSQMRSRVNTTNSLAIENFRRCLEEVSDSRSSWMIHLHDSLHVSIGRFVNRFFSKCLCGSDICICSRQGTKSEDESSHKLYDRACCYERVPGNISCESTRYGSAVAKINFVSKFMFAEFSKFCRNPSTVISCSISANFYYTYLHNYQVALDICRQMLKILNSTYIMPLICTDNFPLLLSCDLMPLYDENIQTVFGFVGLFICVGYEQEMNRGNLIKIPPLFIESPSTGEEQNRRKKRSRHSKVISSLVVQLCPATFIKYIEMQCEKKLSLSYDSQFGIYSGPENETRLRHHAFLLLQCAYSIAQN